MESAEEEAARIAQQLEEEKRAQEALMRLNLSDDDSEERIAGTPETGGKKVARNDPCPCGSGKKYKQCCGKSGPKKGVFAS
jgi:preprotein translocase subunit SecA